jgi:hypothetical protein
MVMGARYLATRYLAIRLRKLEVQGTVCFQAGIMIPRAAFANIVILGANAAPIWPPNPAATRSQCLGACATL